jgi:hypothetical protein
LERSHIVPAFVFRWLKQTGGTDYLRAGDIPNRRIQDGMKKDLFCRECEQLLSGWEKKFAELVFHPFTTESYPTGQYGDWYSKFVASLLYRVGLYFLAKGLEARRGSDDDMEDIRSCLNTWRRFICGEISNPGKFELHQVPVGWLSDVNRAGIPKNWNRYIARDVEFDLAHTESWAFTAFYCKLGRWRLWACSKLRIWMERQST